MSGNDEENPFGVSCLTESSFCQIKILPFEFQDPAVQNAVSTTARVDLDDYNPFDNKTTAQTAEQSPAVMNPTEEPVPAAKPQISTAEFQVLNYRLFIIMSES